MGWFLIGLVLVSVVLVAQILLLIRALIKFDDMGIDDTDFHPKVSILIPAYNEEKSIISCLKAALKQTYDDFEVIVIDDGSDDSTFDLVKEFIEGTDYDNIRLLTKENGGKFSALNMGVDEAKGDWFLAIDSDSFILPETIETLVSKKKENVQAMTTSVGMINSCSVEDGELTKKVIPNNPLVLSQMIEYLRTFTMLKMSMSDINGIGVISGCCGFFDKQFIKDIGYYREELTEDAEITLRIHENGGNVQFISDMLSYTEAPSNLSVLHRQRMRWIRGLLRNMRDYRTKITKGSVKKFLIPYFYISDYILPWFEVAGWISLFAALALTSLSIPVLILTFGVFYVLYLMNTAILMLVVFSRVEKFKNYRQKWKLLLFSLFDFIYYRPIILFLVFKAQLMELFGSKHSWGKMKRKGF